MKQFMDLQPRRWKEIYSLYIHNVDLLSPEELHAALEAKMQEYGFTPEHSNSMVNTLLPTFTADLANSFVSDSSEEAMLTLQDIQYLKQRLQQEESSDTRRLLVAFAIYARANPHHSFWIKYDKKVIGFLASIQKLRVSDQILLTNRLHTLYNLSMQVVGSNQPIPCFRLQWQADQPEPNPETNPLVLLGPLSPATIRDFTDQIPSAPIINKEAPSNNG